MARCKTPWGELQESAKNPQYLVPTLNTTTKLTPVGSGGDPFCYISLSPEARAVYDPEEKSNL